MSIIDRLFRKKSIGVDDVSRDAPVNGLPNSLRMEEFMDAIRNISLLNFSGTRIYENRFDGLTYYNNLAEVFFPIHFIASRIAGAHYEIKKTSNDAIVWCTTRSRATNAIAKLLQKPNEMQTWYQFLYSHMVNYLANGNGYIFAPIPDYIGDDIPKWQWVSQMWSIPASMVQIETETTYKLRIFGIYKDKEIIKAYNIKGTDYKNIKPDRIFHDRDLPINFGQFGKCDALVSPSRLDSVRRNIEVLEKVYDARNTIYENCGALGLITNRTKDEAGVMPLKPEDKKELYDQYNSFHGVTKGRSPILISAYDLAYQQIGLGIDNLKPFEETLADAVAIAGVYEIPPCLIPRKDQSTFNNQANAEKAVYSDVIVRMAKKFCNELTNFLGLTDYYIDVNFNDVDCMQLGRKEAEEVLEVTNRNCRQMFIDGMISYNTWKGKVHEEALQGEIFNKTRMEMSEEEIAYFDKKLDNIFTNTKNPQQDEGTNDESASGNQSE